MNDPAGKTSAHVARAPLDHAAIRAIMMGIMLAMFLSALEQTIVAPALPTIGRTLGDVDNLSWVVTAYLLANTAATPLFGKLYPHAETDDAAPTRQARTPARRLK